MSLAIPFGPSAAALLGQLDLESAVFACLDYAENIFCSWRAPSPILPLYERNRHNFFEIIETTTSDSETNLLQNLLQPQLLLLHLPLFTDKVVVFAGFVCALSPSFLSASGSVDCVLLSLSPMLFGFATESRFSFKADACSASSSEAAERFLPFPRSPQGSWPTEVSPRPSPPAVVSSIGLFIGVSLESRFDTVNGFL